MSSLELHGEEKTAFEQYWAKADADKDGQIGVTDARTFYSIFSLSGPVLGEIWGESNPNKNAALTQEEFYVSLRLVALAQQGKKVERAAAVSAAGPLIPRVAGTSPAPAPVSPPKSAGKGSEWAITQQQVSTFDAVFVATDTDKDGYITGAQARDLFISYGIPVADLKIIWELSDMDKDEKLSRKEFLLAMYLILRHKQHDPLPPSVPQSLIASLNKVAAAGPAASSTTPGPAPAGGAAVLLPFTAEETEWYRKVFEEADTDKDGHLSAEEAREVYLKSNLDVQLLRRVWEMADISRSDKLNLGEFSIGMHLISFALRGNPIPESVPTNVLQSAGIKAQPVTASVPAAAPALAPIKPSPIVAAPPPASAPGTTVAAGGASSLIGALKEATAEANTLRKRVAAADSALLQEREGNATLARQLGDTRVELAELQVNVQRAQEESAKLHEQLGNAQVQREALEDQVALLREWVRSVEESNAATKARLAAESRQLEALHADVKSARGQLQELQKLRAQQDKEAEEVQRGIAQAQEELRQLRETSHAEAIHVAQQGTTVLAAANPFADLVGAPAEPASTPASTLAFGDNFDFSSMGK